MVQIEWFGIAVEATWRAIAFIALLLLLVGAAIVWSIIKLVSG
jgi:hypothetical protein